MLGQIVVSLSPSYQELELKRALNYWLALDALFYVASTVDFNDLVSPLARI